MTAAAAISSLLVPLPAGSDDSFAWLLLWLAVVMVAGKAGGELAVRLRQPAVLGELGAGVLLFAILLGPGATKAFIYFQF